MIATWMVTLNGWWLIPPLLLMLAGAYLILLYVWDWWEDHHVRKTSAKARVKDRSR